MDYLVKNYQQKTGTDVKKNQRAMGKLKKAVENAKRTLSSQQSTKIEIESFENGNDFSETLTRAKFEELNIELFKKTMKPVEQVLKDAGVSKKDIDEVCNALCNYRFTSLTMNIRLSLLAAQRVFPRSNSSSKISSTRNLPRVSTLTRLSRMEPQSKVPSSLVLSARRVVSPSSMSTPSLLVSKSLVATLPASSSATPSSPPRRARCKYSFPPYYNVRCLHQPAASRPLRTTSPPCRSKSLKASADRQSSTISSANST